MIGTYDGEKITLNEVHRFSNDPVSLGGTLYWDTLRQLFEIKQGLTKAKNDGGFSSVGVDTWGVDFALLDKDDRLLESAVHYRDSRTAGIPDEVYKKISKERIYELTGIQFMDFNTIFQLYSLVKDRPDMMERAKTALFIPDLFNFFLSGKKCTEYTEATTGQIIDAKSQNFSKEILDAISVSPDLFPPIVAPGTVIGKLSDDLCEELGLEKTDVVAVGSHDTASAVVSVPAQEDDFIYISCGTWSLFGTETDAPIINEKSEYHNVTNEGGAFGKITFLKNIIGLWLIQESRRQWIRE
ncbi:MAG: rhamnulokinase, partial [Oscillospiraceae bacterium]|nr:rhamnulokinase [Oscillospiraceae bacterium]